MKAEVRVSKSGRHGVPHVQVVLDPKATPEQIGSAINAVYSSAEVYRAGGIRECLTCKSGIDVGIYESFGDAITINIDK